MIKISASILISRIVLLAKFAKLKYMRFTVIWNPQMVQDPLFSFCDRITQTGGRTCLVLCLLPRSGFSSPMLALVGLGCLFIAGPGSSSLLISCVICDEVLFFCKNKKKNIKKKKKKRNHELYTRILSCGRMFTFNSISWMLHVHCTWATCRTPFVNGL